MLRGWSGRGQRFWCVLDSQLLTCYDSFEVTTQETGTVRKVLNVKGAAVEKITPLPNGKPIYGITITVVGKNKKYTFDCPDAASCRLIVCSLLFIYRNLYLTFIVRGMRG